MEADESFSRAACLVLGPLYLDGYKRDRSPVNRGSCETGVASASPGLGDLQAYWPTSVVTRPCQPYAQLPVRTCHHDSSRSGGCQGGTVPSPRQSMAETQSHATSE